MKVLNVCTQMEAGGAQQIAHLLFRHLPRYGHETGLIFLYTRRPVFAEHGNVISLCPRPPAGLEYLRIFQELWRLIRRERPDAVITHTHYSNALVQPIAFCLRIPVRIAVHHGLLDKQPVAARWIDRLNGALGIYTSFVAVSREVMRGARRYPQRYRKRGRVIPNAVDVPGCPPETPSTGLPPGLPLVVAVGRLSPEKDHALLLHAMQCVKRAALLVIGEGPERAHIERLISELGLQERVRLAGEIDRSSLWSLLCRAEALVLPSRHEAMPLVLIEALLAGVPVVAADIPAVREALAGPEDEPAGVLVAERRPEVFAAGIRRVLEDSGFSSSLKQAAKRVAGRYSLDAMIDEYNAALNSAPSGREQEPTTPE